METNERLLRATLRRVERLTTVIILQYACCRIWWTDGFCFLLLAIWCDGMRCGAIDCGIVDCGGEATSGVRHEKAIESEMTVSMGINLRKIFY